MLVVRRKQNQDLIIGDDIIITVGEIEGSRVKLCVRAPKDRKVIRGEVARFGLEWTTGEIAKLCGVLPSSIDRWIQVGAAGVKLKACNKGKRPKKVKERDLYEFFCWLEMMKKFKGSAVRRVIKCPYYDRLKAKYER